MSMVAEYALDRDTALMLKLPEATDSSFDLLLERHRASVVNHLCRLVHNRAIAEELAQDVFIRVYRFRNALSGGSEIHHLAVPHHHQHRAELAARRPAGIESLAAGSGNTRHAQARVMGPHSARG